MRVKYRGFAHPPINKLSARWEDQLSGHMALVPALRLLGNCHFTLIGPLQDVCQTAAEPVKKCAAVSRVPVS